jgi:hypothetical protein
MHPRRRHQRREPRARAAPAESSLSKDVRMNWARRLRRVFGIEIERCAGCGGRLKVIASIEEPELIDRSVVEEALAAP